MNKQADEKKRKHKTKPALKPDDNTLHTPDPQENMERPVSSVMQNIKEKAEENDESKEEADRKKDKNITIFLVRGFLPVPNGGDLHKRLKTDHLTNKSFF
jgi:hypothetical protein